MLKARVYLYNMLQEPSFQKCEVPLVWWPWWPFNAADVFIGSLLPLERNAARGRHQQPSQAGACSGRLPPARLLPVVVRALLRAHGLLISIMCLSR